MRLSHLAAYWLEPQEFANDLANLAAWPVLGLIIA